MPLAPSTKLGQHEISGGIGAGGMGEVYRARDAWLGREVAVKLLPEAFAGATERIGRFEREAKVLASLNHPNIASIYGFEESAGLRALVMELVDGPTLADCILDQRQPQCDLSIYQSEIYQPASRNAYEFRSVPFSGGAPTTIVQNAGDDFFDVGLDGRLLFLTRDDSGQGVRSSCAHDPYVGHHHLARTTGFRKAMP